MKAWRLVAPRWQEGAFDGEGARLYGGRWNSEGTAVVYLGGSLALAALELLVHLDTAAALAPFVALPADFSSDIVTQLGEQLPDNWRDPQSLTLTRHLGDVWAKEDRSALLEVPSAVVPQESNYLFNPAHPQAAELVVGEPQAFAFDPRLVKG